MKKLCASCLVKPRTNGSLLCCACRKRFRKWNELLVEDGFVEVSEWGWLSDPTKEQLERWDKMCEPMDCEAALKGAE